MKGRIIFFVLIVISISAATAFFTYELSKPIIDPTPPWHPFELNSNITLEALVKDGYRCEGTPCGQPQFVKTIRDTSIQYDVSSIDCKEYAGHYEQILKYEEEDIRNGNLKTTEDTAIVDDRIGEEKTLSIQDIAYWKEKQKENPYFPYNIDEVGDCYQGIGWRVFTIKMESIDSLRIIDFVRRNGGYMTYFQDWNSKDGGSFLAHHSKSKLFFICTIKKTDKQNKDSTKWELSIIRDTPYLDQQRIFLERERDKKISKYYKSK